tara:strand:- start:942 stop:1547 length:606 start_codon:yes stop_codon:yes gene_type:complete
MKNTLFLSVLLVLGLLNGFCQSKKNDLKLTVAALPLFGGSEDFESGINGYVLKPGIGYFISDNTSIELNFSYATLNDLKVGYIASYYNSYAFIPTLRNSFVNNEKARIFAEIGFGLGTIKYEANNANFRNENHEALSGGISVLNIGIGANYYFNENFGLEIVIPYISSNNITSENTNNLYAGIGPTIGLTYKLNSKKTRQE